LAIEAISEVWKHSTASGTRLLVLLAMADRARREDGLCWPSVATVAKQARVNARSVQYHLQSLVKAGELRIVRAGGHGAADTTVYQIQVGTYQGAAVCTLQGATEGRKGARHGQIRVQPIAPDPLVNPLQDPLVVTDERTGRLRMVP
jgi:Helix-turn-helix domain